MIVNEDQYWAFVQYIDQSDDSIIDFELEDFDISDFSDVCQVMQRLQGDACAKINFKVSLEDTFHGIFEIIKE